MARIRTVKPSFFRHRALFLAEKETGLPLRIAYEGLWTCADREGRFKWEPEELKLDCLPFDDVDFSRVMDALFTRGFIVKYASGKRQYGVIPTFKDHQIINNREAASALPEPPENLEELVELANLSDASATRDPRDTELHKGKGREGNKEGKGRDRSTREDASPYPMFENFKKEYPKRNGSNPWQPALQIFRQAVKAGHDPGMIIAAAKRYREECERNGIINTEKVAQAVTWLRQSRFLDYQPTPEALVQRVFVREGTEAWLAWQAIKRTPCHNGGWYFDTEYPPSQEAA